MRLIISRRPLGDFVVARMGSRLSSDLRQPASQSRAKRQKKEKKGKKKKKG
jgi:hypothetical protein